MVLPAVQALGPALRRWRALNRVKQEALASDLRVSQTTVSRWESRARLPEGRDARRIIELLQARPAAACDRALADLVRQAGEPMHLICDVTHRLLAVSPARASGWSVQADDLLGTSLWRFSTRGIRAGESRLGDRGWFEPVAEDVIVETERADFPELTIPRGHIRYTRMLLSDGSVARLVRSEPARRAE